MFKKRSIWYFGAVLLILVSLTAGITVSGSGAEYKMVIAHHYPVSMTNNEVQPSLHRFADLVESKTGGAVQVEIFGANQLGTEVEYTKKAQRGHAVQSAILSCGAFSSFFRKYQITATPFLFPDYNTAWAFYNSEWYANFMDEMRKKTGLRWLGMFDDGGGFVAFTNNKHLIKTVEDMKGLRIRTEENPAHQAMINATGAKAVPLEWSQVPQALQTGVSDGQFNAPGLNAAMKFYEYQDYTTWAGFLYNSLNWVVNDEWFKSLPEKYQHVILRSARQAVMYGHGLSAHLTNLGWKECCEHMKKCYIPTPSQKQEFKEVMRPAYYKWATEEFGLKESFIHEVWNKVEEIDNELQESYWKKWGLE